MADMAREIGYGIITLEVREAQSGKLPTQSSIRYSIESSGLKFYYPDSSVQPKSWFDVLATLRDEKNFSIVTNRLRLLALPASPQAFFYDTILIASSNEIKLHLVHSEAFASRNSTYFKGLDITLTEVKDSNVLSVEGQVILSLLGQDIVLSPVLTFDGDLVFRPSVSQNKFLEIPQLGQVSIDSLEVGINADHWIDSQALYTSEDQPTNREEVSKLMEACKANNALTIAAWVKPTQRLSQRDQRPVSIVSLIKDSGEQRFLLGQTVNEGGDNRYVAGLRQRRRYPDLPSFIENLLQIMMMAIEFIINWLIQFLPVLSQYYNRIPLLKSKVFSLNQLSYVVFTWNGSIEENPGRLYINGVDQTDTIDSADLSGDLSQWVASDKFSILLGNKATRPWQGEIYQVALYSRSLSQADVERTYFPTIDLTGSLTLNQIPAPLNQPLRVTLSPDYGLKVSQQGLRVAPFLIFDEVEFVWHTASVAVEMRSGWVKAMLWGNPIEFKASMTAEEMVLSLPGTQQRTLDLQDVGLATLGKIQLTQLVLSTDRTVPQPSWAFATDGRVTWSIIPQPLKGAFPVEIFLENERLWFSVNPAGSLALVDALAFESANLRFECDQQGWQVEPDVRGERHGITLLLLGKMLNLSAQFVSRDQAKALMLGWSDATNQGGTLPLEGAFGKLNLSSFSLEANPVDESLRWRLFMEGQVPLGLDVQETVLDFRTAEGQILANLRNGQQSIELRGKSLLQSLDDRIFRGDLQLLGDRFFLDGCFDLFPNWSVLQVEGNAQIELAPDGTMSCAAPMSVTDFMLLDSKLALNSGRLTLAGLWLGEPVLFNALHRAGQTVWEGAVEMEMPFSLTLGALYDPRSAVKLADQVRVCQTTDCRQIMRAALVTELSSAGFLARVNGSFRWQDTTFTEQDVTLDEFQIFAPPMTRNILLEYLIKQVEAHADEWIGTKFKPNYGYFFTKDDRNRSIIYLGDRTSAFDRALPPSILPNVFKDATTIEVGAFALNQTVESCTLTLKPSGISQADLKSNYLAFLQALEQKSLYPGAATLIKNRIAERLPITLDHLLFYYYGLDPETSQVDLQAGMRLRVDYQNYQFVHPSDPTAFPGFVGSGTSYYYLNGASDEKDAATGFINFDAFFEQVQPFVNTEIAKVGAAGSLDLFQAGYQKPYLRLKYPAQQSSLAGSQSIEQTAMFVGAATLTDLENQTNVTKFHFRGRASVVPEIAVMLQGQPVFVPVGTTLQQLMAQTVSASSGLPGRLLLDSIGRPRLKRLVHEGVSNEPVYQFINLEDNGTVFDLPLVKGDRIVIVEE